MALAIGRLKAARTRASRVSSPRAPGPQTWCLGAASGGSWRHTPSPCLGPNAAQTPRTGAGGHVALGLVPPAHPEPSPAFQSTPGDLLPGASGYLTKTWRPDSFWPARPRGRHRVRGWAELVCFWEEARWAQRPTESRHCGKSGMGFFGISFKRAFAPRPLFSAGGPGEAQPAACPAPCIHPDRSCDKPSYSSSRKRAPTN